MPENMINLLKDSNPDVKTISPTKIPFIKMFNFSFSKMRRLSHMQVKRKRLIPKPDIVIQMLWNVWDMKNGMQMFSPKSSAKGSPVIIDAMGKAKKKE